MNEKADEDHQQGTSAWDVAEKLAEGGLKVVGIDGGSN